MKIMTAVQAAGLALCMAVPGVASADALDDAAKASSQTGIAGRLIYFGLPKQAEVDAVIQKLKPYAKKIRIGVGESGPIYGFDKSARTALLSSFSKAGFKVCTGWGMLSEIAGNDDDVRAGQMALLEQARNLGQTSAFIVDKKPYTTAGLEFFEMDMETVEKGVGTGMDRLFVDIGTSRGTELRDDRAFSVMAAMMSEQTLGGADWDCLNAE